MNYRNGYITIISISGTLEISGVHVRCHGKKMTILYKSTLPAPPVCDAESFADRLEQLAETLRKNRNTRLYLTGHFDSCVLFETRTPELPAKDIRDSLLLEIESRMPQTPAAPGINWISEPAEESSLKIRACAYDAGDLSVIGEALMRLRWKIDGFIPALLALPSEAPGYFREFGTLFARDHNSWVALNASGREKLSLAGQKFISELISSEISADDAFNYGCAISAAAALSRIPVSGSKSDFSVFDGIFRPKRLRNSIIYMSVMLVILAVTGIISFLSSFTDKADVYRQTAGEIQILEQNIQQLKRRIRNAEKDDREYTKILETSHGEDDLLPLIAALSAVIPPDILVTDLKINEKTWDIICLTENENTELSGIFRNIPGFKLKDLPPPQTTRNNLFSYSVKLEKTTQSGGGK